LSYRVAGDGPIMLESYKRVLPQMPELVQRPVEFLVAFDRIVLFGNNNVHFEGFALVAYYLTVVAFTIVNQKARTSPPFLTQDYHPVFSFSDPLVV